VSGGACPPGCTLCRLLRTLCILGAWNRTVRRQKAVRKGELLVEIAVGRHRRDLPLFSCSCILRRPHGSVEVFGAQRGLGRRLRLRQPSSCVCSQAAWPVQHPAALAPAAVGAADADLGPSAGRIGVTMVVGSYSAARAVMAACSEQILTACDVVIDDEQGLVAVVCLIVFVDLADK